jgi:hypothetical protein
MAPVSPFAAYRTIQGDGDFGQFEIEKQFFLTLLLNSTFSRRCAKDRACEDVRQNLAPRA